METSEGFEEGDLVQVQGHARPGKLLASFENGMGTWWYVRVDEPKLAQEYVIVQAHALRLIYRQARERVGTWSS